MTDSLTILDLDSSLTVISALRRFADWPSLILFDSAAHFRERDARYSILTADPINTVRLDVVNYGDQPFSELKEWQDQLQEVSVGSAVPFCGGIAGLMSYELGCAFERLPVTGNDEFRTPAMLAGLYDWAIVWDHIEQTVRLYVLHLPQGDADQRRKQVLQQLSSSASGGEEPASVSSQSSELFPAVVSSFDRESYLRAVERVIEYIRAGDIFQANLSQQLTTQWAASAVQLYEQVRQQNPAPFCGLLQADDFAVVSASPERFLKVDGGRLVETRPIKGTRRRQRSPIADLYAGNELTASEKDRAENVMIVDLLRNDLSRVCSAGSVRVTGLCELEVFETVQHLVSTVVGELSDGMDVWDLCAACFPGGSITGAPKIRAMEIIDELEPTARGSYCGSLFYLGPNGKFDSSILIRTFTLKNGRVQFPVGGGIVSDSSPVDEYNETLHKASGMLRSLSSGGTEDGCH